MSIVLGKQLTNSSIWLHDHAKTNKNTKTMNKTTTQRWTQTQKWWMTDETTTIKLSQHDNTRSSSQSWRLHHCKGCWQIMETAKPQRVLMPHNYGKRRTEQSRRTCHRKGVLDIAYLTIHMDAGVLAFKRHKNLPPRCFDKTSQWQDEPKHTTQHSPVIQRNLITN